MSSIRRPISLAAAVLTAAALGATAFALPATAAGGPPAGPVKIVGGTLDWGVLASYRAYVTGMAKGTITVADGAQQNADGTLRFVEPTGQYDPAGGHVVKAAFKGSVTFSSPAPPTGHGFEVKLSDIRIDTGTKKLTADVTKSGATAQDVPLATVAFAGQSMTGLATTLTKEAADALGSAGYENKAGDPLTANLKFEQPAPEPTPTKPTPTQDPTPTKDPSPTAPADGAQKVLNGKLTWGVKESFRRYVLGAGSITPAGGAAKNGELFDFAFGKGGLDAKKQKLNVSFEGNLRFQYAAHGIDMTFGNPRIDATGKTGTLYVDVKNAAGSKTGVAFATLDLSKTDYKTKNGVLALNGVPAAFTADGAAVFANDTTGSMYKAGDAIDPLTFSVAVDKDATLPPSTGGTTGGGSTGGTTGGTAGTAGGGSVGGGSVGGNLANTGAEIPAGALLTTSGVVIAAGAGAIYMARRRRTAQV
ncbi:HtaA domain-containing protein [Streptomyces erythrochromogenes]|uniref:HtaA domain-containing protein n=1 Tax=Streptomyces erythrochromogenes TaxID=285574 RepID=UPI00224E8A52|nr:HtaA domain-containing protein [Streptomyces erythrochromogenes]MCX5587080.1 HtaA domain-containing protein [Streptomyces erythrochromogenes]